MTEKRYNVGDIDSTERGTGARANSGKVSFTLIPFHLLSGVARVLMAGQLKYCAWNWTKGMPWTATMDSLFRHLFKWWYCREDFDPESGEHHLDHAIANLLFLRHYSVTYKEGDDRPPEYSEFATWLDEINKLFKQKVEEHASAE